MDALFWPSVTVSGSLLLVVAVLHLHTERAWRESRKEQLSTGEQDFLDRKRHRRRQTNVLLGTVAVAILVGAWIRHPWLAVAHWLAVVLLVLWILLLAVADAVATRAYFAGAAAKLVAERAAIDAALKRHQARNHNGKARHVQPESNGDRHAQPESNGE